MEEVGKEIIRMRLEAMAHHMEVYLSDTGEGHVGARTRIPQPKGRRGRLQGGMNEETRQNHGQCVVGMFLGWVSHGLMVGIWLFGW